jgi:predicted transcriptional regulator
MAVEKFSISLDPDLGRALREAASDAGVTASAWMAEAIRQRLRNHLLGLALDDIIREQGWSWEELLQEAAEEDEEWLAGRRRTGRRHETEGEPRSA